jgi:hypothetical protein
MSNRKSGALRTSREVKQLQERFSLDFRDAQAKRREVIESHGSVRLFLKEDGDVVAPEGNLTSKLLLTKDFVGQCGESSREVLDAYLAVSE